MIPMTAYQTSKSLVRCSQSVPDACQRQLFTVDSQFRLLLPRHPAPHPRAHSQVHWCQVIRVRDREFQRGRWFLLVNLARGLGQRVFHRRLRHRARSLLRLPFILQENMKTHATSWPAEDTPERAVPQIARDTLWAKHNTSKMRHCPGQLCAFTQRFPKLNATSYI